jgi:hypothetical protein
MWASPLGRRLSNRSKDVAMAQNQPRRRRWSHRTKLAASSWQWLLLANPAARAAQECSPRREPWVGSEKSRSPRGAKERTNCDTKFDPSRYAILLLWPKPIKQKKTQRGNSNSLDCVSIACTRAGSKLHAGRRSIAALSPTPILRSLNILACQSSSALVTRGRPSHESRRDSPRVTMSCFPLDARYQFRNLSGENAAIS